MQLIKRENSAPFILIYGDTNSGKTTSIVLTAPEPILCISVEGDVWLAVDVADKQVRDGLRNKKVDITPMFPCSHEDLMDFLLKIIEEAKTGKFKHKTVFLDSGTFWMNVKLAIRVEDDRNVGRIGNDDGKLSAQSKTDWTEVNTANSQMSRLTDLLKILSDCGVMVIMTAQLQENPKWNSDLEAGPCFNYKDYNKALKGYFDYIGFTIPNLDDDGDVVYPPNLSFSGEHGYMVKWRGVQPKKLITKFDLSKRFAWFCK
jgi:hypothetical protein